MLHLTITYINTMFCIRLTNSVYKKNVSKINKISPDFNRIIRTKTLNNSQICSII